MSRHAAWPSRPGRVLVAGLIVLVTGVLIAIMQLAAAYALARDVFLWPTLAALAAVMALTLLVFWTVRSGTAMLAAASFFGAWWGWGWPWWGALLLAAPLVVIMGALIGLGVAFAGVASLLRRVVT